MLRSLRGNFPTGTLPEKEQHLDILDISELISRFLKQVDHGDLKTSSYPKTFGKFNFKVSFGQGVAARIPWIAILKEPNKV